MKNVWLCSCVVGTIVPFYFFMPFLLEHGLDVLLLFEFLFTNSVSRFFAIDLVISSLVFLFWSYRDSRRENVTGWWMVLVANCCVGLSLALPLYLYKRER